MKRLGVKFAFTFLAAILYLNISISNAAYAAEKVDFADNASCGIEELIANDNSKTVSIDENGIETTTITDPQLLKAIEERLVKPNDEANLKSFVVQKDTKLQEELNDEGLIRPYFISSIQRTYTSESCGSSRIGYVSGTGPLKLEVSRSVSTEISGNINAGIDVIGAELGFKISESYTVTGSTSYTTGPRGGSIVAYPSYTNIGLQVYRFGFKAESGYILIADGVCFATYDD